MSINAVKTNHKRSQDAHSFRETNLYLNEEHPACFTLNCLWEALKLVVIPDLQPRSNVEVKDIIARLTHLIIRNI